MLFIARPLLDELITMFLRPEGTDPSPVVPSLSPLSAVHYNLM